MPGPFCLGGAPPTSTQFDCNRGMTQLRRRVSPEIRKPSRQGDPNSRPAVYEFLDAEISVDETQSRLTD
jgi:hypothetical protein